jgi:hypothetical protein
VFLDKDRTKDNVQKSDWRTLVPRFNVENIMEFDFVLE